MKFLCDNCKAKYQIGDEKVAGKTVRMKCRRCGHLRFIGQLEGHRELGVAAVPRRVPAAATEIAAFEAAERRS